MGWNILFIISIPIFIMLVLFIWIKIKIIYVNNKLCVYLKILFLKFRLISDEKKLQIDKKEKKTDKKKNVKKKTEKQEKKLSNGDIFILIKSFKNILNIILNYFKKYFIIEIKKIYIKVASDDAAKTALMYGAISQSVEYIYAFLDNNIKKIKFKKRDSMMITADFVTGNPDFFLDVTCKLRIWQFLLITIKSITKYFNDINNGGK